MKNINKLFMAIAKGRANSENTEIKRYVGIAPVSVLAVNPNKKTLEKIYNTTLEKDIEYVSTTEDNSGKKVETARIDFIVKTDAARCNDIDFITKVSFFIKNQFRTNKDNTKVQVIDKYGRTAWVTKEQYKTKEIPVYSNGPANIDKDYRACYVGEEVITEFIKCYLNIPNVMKYVENKWVMVENPEDSEIRLDHIPDYFKGNFEELEGIPSLQPENKLKVLFGVKTTDDNKLFQAVFTECFLRNNMNKYDYIKKALEDRKNAGAYPNTEFEICTLKEYKVTPTNFDNKTNVEEDMPDFGDSSNPWA